MLFTDGAGEDQRLRVGGVGLGVQLVPVASLLLPLLAALLVLVRLAGASDAGRGHTLLIRLM